MGDSYFTLFYCTDSENLEIKRVNGYARESRSKEVKSKWLKGVYSQERTQEHNNFKSENLILKQNV